MKKSVLFLINGLGIEKPGSYSISIDQTMPNLSKTKETSFFTSAITSSLEYKSAYQQFFLGDTYKMEMDFLKNLLLGGSIDSNPTYINLCNSFQTSGKIHLFLEATNIKIADLINEFFKKINLDSSKQIFLHLILPQQDVNEFGKVIDIINHIKYNIGSSITVGFIIGKETLKEELDMNELTNYRKILFYCSCERWTNTEDKLKLLAQSNVIPCNVPCFCAINTCNFSNGDTIMFFNSRHENYDNFINVILKNAPEVFKGATVNLPIFSLTKLYSKYNVSCLCEDIVYENSFANILARNNKKALIFTDQAYLNLVNFNANGLQNVNNPNIAFVLNDENLYNPEYITNIIDNTDYDIIIFDNNMEGPDVVSIKDKLEKMDKTLGLVANTCCNKHSLFITSLYGMKKTLPVAPYNEEQVMINYETQIPIFFYDYSYLRSKYRLFPGETNDILMTAIRCIVDDPKLYSLIKEKGFNGLLKMFKKES